MKIAYLKFDKLCFLFLSALKAFKHKLYSYKFFSN